MKNILTAFLFLSMGLFVSSCGDDTCDVLSETVVGTWTIEAIGSGTVTINEDGSFTQTENLIYDSTFDNDTLSWTVSATSFSLLAMDDNNGTTETVLAVESFDCETITATNGGNTLILVKQ